MPLPDRIPPLSRADLTVFEQFLARQQRRRRAYRPGPLRVYANGHEHWQGDPRAGTCAPFRVPLTAAVLEVFGADAEGALLLAVCPLRDPEVVADEGVQHLSVTLEGGQTVALTIALGDGPRGRGGRVRHPAGVPGRGPRPAGRGRATLTGAHPSSRAAERPRETTAEPGVGLAAPASRPTGLTDVAAIGAP
jgi:hypothetical protein